MREILLLILSLSLFFCNVTGAHEKYIGNIAVGEKTIKNVHLSMDKTYTDGKIRYCATFIFEGEADSNNTIPSHSLFKEPLLWVAESIGSNGLQKRSFITLTIIHEFKDVADTKFFEVTNKISATVNNNGSEGGQFVSFSNEKLILDRNTKIAFPWVKVYERKAINSSSIQIVDGLINTKLFSLPAEISLASGNSSGFDLKISRTEVGDHSSIVVNMNFSYASGYSHQEGKQNFKGNGCLWLENLLHRLPVSFEIHPDQKNLRLCISQPLSPHFDKSHLPKQLNSFEDALLILYQINDSYTDPSDLHSFEEIILESVLEYHEASNPELSLKLFCCGGSSNFEVQEAFSLNTMPIHFIPLIKSRNRSSATPSVAISDLNDIFSFGYSVARVPDSDSFLCRNTSVDTADNIVWLEFSDSALQSWGIEAKSKHDGTLVRAFWSAYRNYIPSQLRYPEMQSSEDCPSRLLSCNETEKHASELGDFQFISLKETPAAPNVPDEQSRRDITNLRLSLYKEITDEFASVGENRTKFVAALYRLFSQLHGDQKNKTITLLNSILQRQRTSLGNQKIRLSASSFDSSKQLYDTVKKWKKSTIFRIINTGILNNFISEILNDRAVILQLVPVNSRTHADVISARQILSTYTEEELERINFTSIFESADSKAYHSPERPLQRASSLTSLRHHSIDSPSGVRAVSAFQRTFSVKSSASSSSLGSEVDIASASSLSGVCGSELPNPYATFVPEPLHCTSSDKCDSSRRFRFKSKSVSAGHYNVPRPVTAPARERRQNAPAPVTGIYATPRSQPKTPAVTAAPAITGQTSQTTFPRVPAADTSTKLYQYTPYSSGTVAGMRQDSGYGSKPKFHCLPRETVTKDDFAFEEDQDEYISMMSGQITHTILDNKRSE